MSEPALIQTNPDMLGIRKYLKSVETCGEYDCYLLDVPGLAKRPIALFCATDRILTSTGKCDPYLGIPGKGRISRAISMHWYLKAAECFHSRSHFSSSTLRDIMGKSAFDEFGDRCVLCGIRTAEDMVLTEYQLQRQDELNFEVDGFDRPIVPRELIHRFLRTVVAECDAVNVGIEFPLSVEIVSTEYMHFLSPLTLGLDRCNYTISGTPLSLNMFRTKTAQEREQLITVQPHILQAIAFECEFLYKLIETKNPHYGIHSGEIPFTLMKVGKIKQDYD